MPVIKTKMDRYRVLNNGEWATIALNTWSTPRLQGHGVFYGGEILVHSSFGNFSYTWSASAIPVKQMLCTIAMDNFMQKCMGTDYRQYDGPATVRKVKEAIVVLRRKGEYSAETANEVWVDFECVADQAAGSETGFYLAVEDLCNSDTRLGDAEQYVCTQPNPQAVGFWQDLWPHFVAALQQELATATAVTP